MNRIFSALGVSLWIALLSPMVQAATLKTLDVAALPGDRVELKLVFDEPPPAPRGYTTESPARIALDLPGVVSQLASKTRDLGNGNARSATVVEAKDRARLIINLNQLSPYDFRSKATTSLSWSGRVAKARPRGRPLPPSRFRRPSARLRRRARPFVRWISSVVPRAKAMS